jgi:hypothetical protein
VHFVYVFKRSVVHEEGELLSSEIGAGMVHPQMAACISGRKVVYFTLMLLKIIASIDNDTVLAVWVDLREYGSKST